MNTENPIRRAVAIVGNRSKLAREMNITPQAIRKYERAIDAGKVDAVPPKRALQLEEISGLGRHIFRSDLWTAPSEAA